MPEQVDSCVFCLDWSAGRDVIADTRCFFFRWDKYPVARGHLLIIPKRHVERIADLSDDEGTGLVDAMKRGIEIVNAKVGAQATNVGINDGEAAGQTVRHLHVHIIPRWRGDVPDARGGVRGVIPNRARY
jgi:diadenosine tetraphosphate (Ap4A) HIT family hydrolase